MKDLKEIKESTPEREFLIRSLETMATSRFVVLTVLDHLRRQRKWKQRSSGNRRRERDRRFWSCREKEHGGTEESGAIEMCLAPYQIKSIKYWKFKINSTHKGNSKL